MRHLPPEFADHASAIPDRDPVEQAGHLVDRANCFANDLLVGFGMMFASIADANVLALERTWVKLCDLYRSLSSSGLVWFEKLARYTRAYSRLLIPSARSKTPSNEGRWSLGAPFIGMTRSPPRP